MLGGDVSEYASCHPFAHQVRCHHQDYVARHNAELPLEQRISLECLDYNCVLSDEPTAENPSGVVAQHVYYGRASGVHSSRQELSIGVRQMLADSEGSPLLHGILPRKT